MRRVVPTAAALTAALAAATSTAAAPAASSPRFVFGRSGGNIRPFSVTISRTGRLTARGAVTLARPDGVIPTAALRGLLTLAKNEGFYRLQPTIVCNGALPDIASLFVTVTASGRTKSVSVRGGCNRRFAELYAVLSAVAGVE